MTHEELLAVLNNVITDDVHHLATQTAQALRAVVELHKPIKDEWFQTGVICEKCSKEEYTELYPCSTIEAIEKELA